MGNLNEVLTVCTALQVFVFVRTDLEDRAVKRIARLQNVHAKDALPSAAGSVVKTNCER